MPADAAATADPAPRPLRQEQEDASDEVTEVAPGILRLQLPIAFTGLGHVNCWALEDDRGVALVDPGLPGEESWRTLQARLGDAGIPLRHVHSVLITHSHPDHFGGAGLLAEESGADIVASEHFRLWWDTQEDPGEPELEGADDAEGDDDAPLPFERPNPWGGSSGQVPPEDRRALRERRDRWARWFRVPRPTVSLVDAQPARFAERDWVAVHTPGHTSDHLCLFSPADGILLAGDHVLPSITPHISGLLEGDPLAAYLESLDKVSALDGVHTVLPAHGHPFTDLPGRVAAIRQHHADRLAQLRRASDSLGWASVADLSHELFSPRSWGTMAESETYAHLEHLRFAGEAERREEAGELLFKVR